MSWREKIPLRIRRVIVGYLVCSILAGVWVTGFLRWIFNDPVSSMFSVKSFTVFGVLSLLAFLGCLPTFVLCRLRLGTKTGLGLWQSALTWALAGSIVFWTVGMPLHLNMEWIGLMLVGVTLPGAFIGLIYFCFDNDKYSHSNGQASEVSH